MASRSASKIMGLSSLPRIGITMGEPAGVGPEIILKAFWQAPDLYKICVPVILGDHGVIQKAETILTSSLMTSQKVRKAVTPLKAGVQNCLNFLDSRFRGNDDKKNLPLFMSSSLSIPILPLSKIPMHDHQFGIPRLEWASHVMQYISKGVELAKSGLLDALVTSPIHKETLHQAGFPFPGHTEYLAHLLKVKTFGMMLVSPELRVSLVTIHIPLKEVPEAITRKKVLTTLRLTHETLQKYFGFAKPRLALAALNPHAGEGGSFGDEEKKILIPAVKKAQKEGIRITGPLPADSLFYYARKGAYDAVVALYHDQGLIPLKTLSFEEGVNITMGLPIIRTSVDHGTALAIAGTGQASPKSLIAAIRSAVQMVKNSKQKTVPPHPAISP